MFKVLFPDSLAYNIALGPGSIVLGLGSGALWGLISKYIPEKGDVSTNSYFSSNLDYTRNLDLYDYKVITTKS